MSPKDISDMISQVGFPVVVTLLLLYQQMKTNEGYYDLIKQVEQLVENNTKILNSMVEKVNDQTSK
jgi:hypothetical protein